MKHLGTISVYGVIGFWLLMNALLVLREVETTKLEGLQRGVNRFLGSELKRERWMAIYRKSKNEHKKVGYTGLSMEKLYSEEGVEYHVVVETFFRGSLPFQGFFSKQGLTDSSLSVAGEVILDQDLEPRKLHVDVTLDFLGRTDLKIYITGKRQGEKFLITVLNGAGKVLEVPIPLEKFTLSDGFAPALPVAGFRVGESYRLRVFDPLALGSQTAVVRVVGQRTEEIHGALVDVYELETEWRGNRMHTLVTDSGEVIRQELGGLPGIVLQHEKSREHAMKGFEQ